MSPLTAVLADEERLRRGLPVDGPPLVFAFGRLLRPSNDEAGARAFPYLSAFARSHEMRGRAWTREAISESVDEFCFTASVDGRRRLFRDASEFAGSGGALGARGRTVFGAASPDDAAAAALFVQRALAEACAEEVNFEDGDFT